MRRISEIIRTNKFYTVLAVFVIAINLLVFMGWMAEKAEEREGATLNQEEVIAEEEPQEEETKLFDEADLEARQARLADLAETNPPLYVFIGVFNLGILFVIFLGMIFDVYFLTRWFKKDPVKIRISDKDPPRWNFADVVKVTLIFTSFGYFFIIVQALVAKFFPMLNNENFRMVFNTGVMNLVGISVMVYFVVKKHGQKIRDMGLSLVKWPAGAMYGVIGYIALVPVLLGIMIAIFYVVKLIGYEPPVQPIVEVFMKEKETSILWMSALFAAIFGPIAEEIFFRGFMYPAVKKKFGIFWAMAGTSAIFAFLHAHIVGFLPIMFLGLLLAYLYEKTGSLVAPIVVHVTHNVGMVFLVFMMRYLEG